MQAYKARHHFHMEDISQALSTMFSSPAQTATHYLVAVLHLTVYV